MKKITIATIILCSVLQFSVAQKRLAVYGMQNIGGTKSANIVPEKIISYFSSDPDYIIIDRKNKQLIKSEMRLQKSESFIDGYIVEQGKAEGADMICQSIYDHKSNLLIIQFIDVASGETVCTKERILESNWLSGLKNLNQEVTIMLHEISSNCFDKGFPVVRITKESKGKAKELLILAGYAQKVKLEYRFEIVMGVEETIGTIKKIRKTVIGSGYISAIEDENFSTLKVDDGKKEVYKALKDGVSLECRLINDKK